MDHMIIFTTDYKPILIFPIYFKSLTSAILTETIVICVVLMYFTAMLYLMIKLL